MLKPTIVAISVMLVLQAVPGSDRARSADARGDPVRLERSEEAMGSSFSLVLYGAERARLEAAADLAFREAHRLDAMLSNYQDESEWSHVNREAAAHPVDVTPELFSVLSSCWITPAERWRVRYHRRGIDEGLGILQGEGRMPRPADVTDALASVGYRHVLLDPSARTVRFSRRGIELDPGGIGKGYAVDRIVDDAEARKG